jgi:DNA-binding beta-propeller fold protein YncE
MNHHCRSAGEVLLGAALVLGCIGHGAALAASIPSETYTLLVGDSQRSVANGVFFDGKYIWAAVENPDGGVVEKISTQGEVLAIASVGSAPVEMAYDGANIWVTDYVSSDVQVINQSGIVVKIFYLAPSANPEGITFDGEYMWTANNGPNANSVSKFDAATQTLVATYPVGLLPDGVAYDGRYVWVTNSYSNNVWTLNRDSGQQIDSYSTGTFPLSIVYDGQNMWIGNGTGVNVGTQISGKGSLTKIRAADGTPLGTFTIGNHVRGLTYDGTSIWACNSNDNTVSRVRVSDVALLATYPTGKGPRAVAFDGANIWVANSGENSLTIIASEPIRRTTATAAQPPGGGVRLNGLLAPNPITVPAAVPPAPGPRATAAALSELLN